MTMRTQQVLHQIETRLQQASLETEQLHRLQRSIGADVARQDQELDDAWGHLAEVLVPFLDVASLDALATRMRLPAVAAQAVIARRQATLSRATTRRVELLADPRLRDAEAIENEVQIRLAELDEAMVPLRTSTSAMESTPYFMELLAHRYGTDEYTMRFWQLGFYTHWKNADLIVAAFGPRSGAVDFKTLAARYVDEKTALDELQRGRSALLARRQQLNDLQRELAEVDASINDVDSVTLQAVRTRVVDHLRPLDEQTLVAIFANHDAGLLACKRIIGIGKKKAYLSSLEQEQVKSGLEEMQATNAKLARSRTKLTRSKYFNVSWPDTEVERLVGPDRRERWGKRRESMGQARTHIVEFHHYERWNPAADFLWWDVMSDGRLDGNFIPEVRARGPVHQAFFPDVSTTDWRDDRSFDAS